MARGFANPEPLVSSEWLREHLDDPTLRVFDTTVHLVPDPPRSYRVVSGREDYEAGHVPGAGFLDLTGELSDPASKLPFTRPAADQLEQVLSRAGVGPGQRVVLYSSSHVMWATRVWWLLRASGFDAAAVLDGGLARWRSEGHPVATDACSYPAARFEVRARPELWADRAEVLESIERGSVCTINALPRAVHTGEADMSYGRKGHIAGSVNVSFGRVVSEPSGSFRAQEELRAEFDRVGAFERERVITYCGGGIAATTDAMALTLLGHPDVAVYDGSLAEWCSDPSLPMQTGDE
jgi:thiosulfate/3-mercaptopyruvate sulfurtransferase